MDDILLAKAMQDTPKFNQSIVNGLAVDHLMKVNPETGVLRSMAYIDQLIRINSSLFPEGLEYIGSAMCDPVTQFYKLTHPYQSKRIANIARSDTFLVKYQFAFKGNLLHPQYVLLPFVGDGGLIHLNGALYNISPVLSDVGYSVLRGSLFIPFRRTKLTFNQVPHNFLMNDQNEIEYVIWSMIHKKMAKIQASDHKNRPYIDTCLAQYFFAKWGVIETMRIWGGVNVELGWLSDFPAKEYPRSHYNVYRSANLLNRHPNAELCIVAPKIDDDRFLRKAVASFFYVFDVFPDQFNTPQDADNPVTWHTILGYMILGDNTPISTIMGSVDTHMQSFEKSLDGMTRDDLADRGVYVDNIWELLHRILTDLSVLLYQNSTDEATMYGKRLMVQRYVMEEFNSAISLFAFHFQSQPDREWTEDDINDNLKKHFKLKRCERFLTSQHGEINTVSYPGDNKNFRITSMLIPQDKARRTKGYSKGLLTDASRLLHSSIAEVAQFNNQPKNNPDGRGRLNPTLQTEDNGEIRCNPERQELLERTQRRFHM